LAGWLHIARPVHGGEGWHRVRDGQLSLGASPTLRLLAATRAFVAVEDAPRRDLAGPVIVLQ